MVEPYIVVRRNIAFSMLAAGGVLTFAPAQNAFVTLLIFGLWAVCIGITVTVVVLVRGDFRGPWRFMTWLATMFAGLFALFAPASLSTQTWLFVTWAAVFGATQLGAAFTAQGYARNSGEGLVVSFTTFAFALVVVLASASEAQPLITFALTSWYVVNGLWIGQSVVRTSRRMRTQ